jgi:LysM repeat protein
MMKKIAACLIMTAILLVCLFLPQRISRASVENEQIAVVTVEKGDTIWHIAAKHSSDSEDVREKVAAIRKLNNLDKMLIIYAGQQIKVPVSL